MKRIANAFWSEDEGNVAMDWMVLMAGIVSLGFAVVASVALSAPEVTADSGAPAQTREIAAGA
ncbi:hypothetical protein [Vannielia litorea]|uniref:Uncharacterized protein n=1 Tax=Vannielia litorea TaxID=1217970 RepID=A0A1N6GNJ1_9RHOB|nr:hypothetical protein [Vannielia litorea]SIO09058.1 hypothetical protein SAMN05444002_2641 [Vannielia litorea]